VNNVSTVIFVTKDNVLLFLISPYFVPGMDVMS